MDFTLYELEIITRLSLTIADTIALIQSNKENSCKVNINIDIPDFQYYWTACDLLAQGTVSISYVQRWIYLIDRRKVQLARLMTSLIQSSLQERQLASININIASGASAACSLVKKTIQSGGIPTLDEMVGVLQSEACSAPLWRK